MRDLSTPERIFLILAAVGALIILAVVAWGIALVAAAIGAA